MIRDQLARNELSVQKGQARLDRFSRANLPPEKPRAIIKAINSVKSEPIEWLWYGRIALGKVTMITGDPGLGKSMIAALFASHVSNGRSWPVDHAPCIKGNVLLVSAEDGIGDTIRPRLEAVDANLEKISFLDCVEDYDRDGTQTSRDLSLKKDIETLELSLPDDCKLIVIDPISAYLGNADSHNNSEIRGLLKPLSDMASRKRVAVVVISHLNKGGQQSSAMYRTTGSLAFVAAARAVYVVAKDQDDPERRLFLPIKNNLGKDNTGLAYSISETSNGIPFIEWEPEPVRISADDALVKLPDNIRSERDDAAEWLRDKLRFGAVKSDELLKSCKRDGIAEKTLRRAKSDLGVRSVKREFDGGWAWLLPEHGQTQDSHPCYSPVATFDTPIENQGLRADFTPQDTQDGQGGQSQETRERVAL